MTNRTNFIVTLNITADKITEATQLGKIVSIEVDNNKPARNVVHRRRHGRGELLSWTSLAPGTEQPRALAHVHATLTKYHALHPEPASRANIRLVVENSLIQIDRLPTGYAPMVTSLVRKGFYKVIQSEIDDSH